MSGRSRPAPAIAFCHVAFLGPDPGPGPGLLVPVSSGGSGARSRQGRVAALLGTRLLAMDGVRSRRAWIWESSSPWIRVSFDLVRKGPAPERWDGYYTLKLVAPGGGPTIPETHCLKSGTAARAQFMVLLMYRVVRCQSWKSACDVKGLPSSVASQKTLPLVRRRVRDTLRTSRLESCSRNN